MRISMLALVAFLFVLPASAEAQENQCGTSCCYCDLAAGQCKDVSTFPGGGGTGYTNCNVNGMTCNYWGSSCRDEFAFAEVGPDGVIRTFITDASISGEDGSEAIRTTVIASDGSTQLRDCRRFVVGIRMEPAILARLSTKTSSITL
jgi:hypothetical protein